MRKSKKKEYRENGKCLYNGIAVSYRVCDHNYKCKTCEFHQLMVDYGTEPKEKLCIYSGTEVAYRICDNAYNCATCEFNQLIQDQQATREEAIPFYKDKKKQEAF